MTFTPASRMLFLCGLLILSACSAPLSPSTTPSPPSETTPSLPPASDDTLAYIDQQAQALATQFMNGQEEALNQALSASGIAIRRLTGELLQPAQEPALGLALAQNDPEALAHLQAKGGTGTLQELADTLNIIWPQADAKRLPALIQADLRSGVNSTIPTVRFWARFIVALDASPSTGRLLESNQPGQINITAAQQSLLLLRLAGGVTRLAQARGVSVPTQPQAGLRTQGEVANCTFGGTEGTIMDGVASGITTGVGELLGYLDSVSALPGESAADTASGLLGKANLALSYMKFMLTMASFRMDLTTDTDTLQRTRSTTQEGEGVVTARAKVSYDLSANWQYANCMRLALNVAGIDFSVPNAGVVEGASIRWRIFAAQGKGSYADQHLSVIAARPGEEIMHDKTGTDGVAEVQFEGLRQRDDLGPAPTAVVKTGEVTAITSIKGSALAADMVDALGTGAGGVGGILNMPTELIYRMWPISATIPIKVRDWAPACSDIAGNTCWLGTITVKDQREEKTILRDPNKQPAGTDLKSADTNATYTVTTGVDPDGQGRFVLLETQSELQSRFTHRLNYDASYDVLCADEKTHVTDVARATVEENSTAQIKEAAKLSLFVMPEGSYQLQLNYGEENRKVGIRGTIRSTSYYKGGCNPYKDHNTSTESVNERVHFWGGLSVEGQSQSQDGIMTLTGSKVFTLRVDGLPTTRSITWNIRRVILP